MATASTDPTRNALYRSRSGLLLGVCRGVAQHLGVSVTGMRILLVVLMFFTGFWPMVGLYVLAALILRKEPTRPFATRDEEAFYQTYAHRHQEAVERLKSTYERLNRRLAHLEHAVTDREFQWRERLER